MPGGRASKSRGTSYEYRVRDWFNARPNWSAERIILSGAVKSIADELGKNDVKAQHQNGTFLQIECKKTGDHEEHVIQWAWLEKIDFTNDEFLVFAFGRSDHYVLVKQEIYAELDKKFIPSAPNFTAEGDTRFKVKREWFVELPVTVFWSTHNQMFVVTTLDRYVELLEARGPLKTLQPIEVIKAATAIEPLIAWYKEFKHRLTSYERSLYYAKLHRLENDIDDKPTAEFIATNQWWRDTSQDFVMQCPHCKETITHQQLQIQKEKNDNQS